MGIDWGSTAFLVAIVYALTEFVKTLAKDKLGQWVRLIAIALGFGAIYFATYAPEIVKLGFIIGITASGIYDIRVGKVPAVTSITKTVSAGAETVTAITKTAATDEIK